MASTRSVCAECRTVDLSHECEHETIWVSHKWRAPRKDNHKAWKRIARGNILWDMRAISRSQRRRREKIERVRQRRIRMLVRK